MKIRIDGRAWDERGVWEMVLGQRRLKAGANRG
jgi:hypothetical protein